MKQTVVEWLVIEINKLTGLTIQMDENCIIQAKAMEKEQIIDAYNKGWSNSHDHEFMSAERYYSELNLSEYDKHQIVKNGCTGPK